MHQANTGAAESEKVDLNHLIEIQLAESVSLADIAFLEQEFPGVGAAVSEWLLQVQ